MKYCKSLTCLLKAIDKQEPVKMFAYDIQYDIHGKGSAYINLGEGRYLGVGKDTWNKIKDYVEIKR